jgi:hypothetical protein
MLLVRTVLRPSTIDGIGCFAAQPVKRGMAIWRFVAGFDRLFTPDAAERFDREFLERYAQQCPQTGFWILCADNARLINHSDQPNMRCAAPLWEGRVTHDAVRDIKCGEEITCDYRIGDALPFSGFAEAAE